LFDARISTAGATDSQPAPSTLIAICTQRTDDVIDGRSWRSDIDWSLGTERLANNDGRLPVARDHAKQIVGSS
jgi:hypothetical protein